MKVKKRMPSSSLLKLDIHDFKNIAEKIGHNILVLKWLLAPNALLYATDEVTEILLNNSDPIIRKQVEMKVQKLRDIELNRRMSSLDASQLLVIAQLIAEANVASKKLRKRSKK